MTRKEMTELFTAMLLAWPNAEAFRGGISKLKPTIKLWTTCTTDVDFWTGQQAFIRLCQKCKFPPTIAEFRDQVENIDQEIKSITDRTFREIRSAELTYGSIAAFYAKLPPGNLTKAVIDAVGGVDALTTISKDRNGREYSMWNWQSIEDACQAIIRRQPKLVGGEFPALNAPETRR